MILQQTADKLQKLKLTGMLQALQEQEDNRSYSEMTFQERFEHLVDQEYLEKTNRRIAMRIRLAKFRQQGCIKNIDFKASRNLNKSEILELDKCRFIKENRNVIITGASGVGKSYLACSLGHSACLNGYKVSYARIGRLLTEIGIGRGDGSYIKLIKSLSKFDLLILDDWGLTKLTQQQREDFLEIMEDRYSLRSTIMTSQLPVDKWHEIIGDSTIADAILDRIIHNSYRINLKGDSMRKKEQKRGGKKI